MSMRDQRQMTYRRLDTLDTPQIEQIHGWYAREWWTQGRSLEDVASLVEHSDLIFAYADAANGDLAAFARVLTDRTIKALILDVIVDPA
jgi:hypothetical protein